MESMSTYFLDTNTQRILENNRIYLNDPTIMMSFFPKEKIHTHSYRRMYDNICFMNLKISGIMEFAERCDRMGLNDPSKFMKALDDYFDPIISTLKSNSGDIIEFFPNEIWTIWKCPNDDDGDINVLLKNLVHEIINCALHITRMRDTYELSEGIISRTEIIISMGSLAMNKIETNENTHWIFFGGIFSEIKEASRINLPGQILLSLLGKVDLLKYYYQTEEYGKYVKILGIGPNWKEKLVDTTLLIDGQFVVNETSSEETIFNSFQNEKHNQDKKHLLTVSDANRLKKVLPQPLIKCLTLCKSIEYACKIQAIAVLHIKIKMATYLSEDTIDFAEIIMRTLCSIIHERKGYLHKTRIHKMNIQTVFVFGNNEETIHVNCKEAMNNAMGCFITFKKLKEINKISVAVTSGMCYSGILDNSERRSYMVISSCFKITSKLLKLYPGKIVSDKKTILHSGINEKQFVLLEYKPLRAGEMGPVFEYVGTLSWEIGISQDINYPLIGNGENLKVLYGSFQQFKANFNRKKLGKYVFEDESFGAIVIGEEGQGKSRILEEFCWRMKHKNLIKFKLKPEHETVQYYTIRTFFDSLPVFQQCKTTELKKSKLREFLRGSDFSEFLCFLNVVFKTDFEINEIFETSSEEEKSIVLEQMLRRLGYQCFENPYLIVIDNSEFIDGPSSNILYEFMENKICFTLMALNSCHYLSIENERLTKHKNIISIYLEKMEDQQLAAFICQVLNVNAISTELDKHIQQAGDGNPKKIEKILFEMIQNNEVVLKLMSHAEIKSLSLCVPSFHLTKRIPSNENLTISPHHLMQDSEMKYKGQTDIRENKLPVCLIAPMFSKQKNANQTNDRTHTFDSFESLSNGQKFVLQAASVLSETFPRSMLVFVMNLKNKEKTEMDIAEAIQGLFELGILCCAKCRLSERDMIISKRKDVDVSHKCDCHDSSTSDFFGHLPKYSFCQFMKFSSISFREFVCEDVLPQIASELHTRALEFLNKETRSCNACGNGLMDIGEYRLIDVVNLDVNSNTDFYDFFKQTNELFSDDVQYGKDKILDIYKEYSSFSNRNFPKCECEIILCSVFKQLVEHYRELDQFPEMFKSIEDYAETCFILKYYEKALVLLEYGLKSIQASESFPNKDLCEGTFTNLIGMAYLKLDRRDEAIIKFIKTLEILGEPFPSSSIGLTLKLYSMRLKKTKNLYNCLMHPNKKQESLYQCDVSRILARSLTGLFRIYKYREDWKRAELCAFWALSKSIVKIAHFSLILECITNLIVLAIHQRNSTVYKNFENYGMQLCTRNIGRINKKHSFHVLRFYKKCFIFRLHYIKMEQTAYLGKIIIQLAVDIDSVENILSSFTYIIIELLFSEKLSEVFSLIRKMEYYAADIKYFRRNRWFYISNMMTLLETGYSLTTLDECETNIPKNWKRNNKHFTEKYKLVILLWLWYIRNEKWGKSFELFAEIGEHFHFLLSISDNMGLWILYVFEGVLLYLAQRTKDRNILSYSYNEELILQICKKIENINVAQIYTPRQLHLKAYYELIKNDERSNRIFLEKATSTAYENSNSLEISWIEHSKRVWFNSLPDFLKDAWRDKNSKSPSEYDSTDKILHFTLIVPVH